MDKILEVKNLKVSFRTTNGTLKAVRDISFDLERGRTLAIVGESGSGKSVTSKAVLGILAGNSIVEGGEILYDGKDLLKISEDEMYKIRGDKISMIFQDPLSSLNPIVKIGKQITEAMLLKNKASRREARIDFNSLLKELEKNMDAGSHHDMATVKQMTGTFDKFCIEANRLENRYNTDAAVAEDLSESIKDFLFKMEKKQKLDVKATLSGYKKKLKSLSDPFFTSGYTDKLSSLADKIDSVKGDYHKGDEGLPKSIITVLEDIDALLTEMMGKTRPNFFRIGYYSLNKPIEELIKMPVEEANEVALKYLNENFMNRFVEVEHLGVEYSFNEKTQKKKELVSALEEAKKYYSGEFEKSPALKYCKELSAKVDESIDRLEVNKDSTFYTFHTSLENAINKYFRAKVNNPKEERRFARQSAKRDKLIARGKHIDWKVVPKVVYDLDELKDDIVKVIANLEDRCLAYIDAAPSVDLHERCVEIVDYMKDKASKVVYKVTRSMAKEKAIKLMEEVGINEPRMRYYQYPFEFSGGMRQRIVIAIALSADPEILVCDEPTTALDVTIQAQILELINRLKEGRNLSVIFITHDLGVVANMADDIAVMYAGKIVEYGTADDIFYDPRHPYTWALLSSMPDLDTKEKLDAIPGTPPNMIYPPVGDAFADRNKYAMQIDFEAQPPMFEISETHKAATWLLHPDAPKVEVPKIITDRIARMLKTGGAE